MKTLLPLLLLASACDLHMENTCHTTEGMEVVDPRYDIPDCQPYNIAEGIINAHFNRPVTSNWPVYVIATDTADGAYTYLGSSMWGNTECGGTLGYVGVWIGWGTNQKDLARTAFFHEMMHVADHCSTPNHEGWDVPGGQRDQWVAMAQEFEQATK